MAVEEYFDTDCITLLKNPIQKFEKIHPSLITVLRASSELNLSNLLSYFFQGDYSKFLQTVFIEALYNSIKLNEKDATFLDDFFDNKDNIEVHSEYVTTTGRIDILLICNSKNQYEKSAIIVENKLYHTLNNDLDDYMYTVSKEELIEPDRIAVVVLSLKETIIDSTIEMKIANVLHRDLKDEVLTLIGSNLNNLYDSTPKLLFGEYLKHVDDLYSSQSSFINDNCKNYFIENLKTIQNISNSYRTLNALEFSRIHESVKKFLFENKTNIDQVIELQENILEETNEKFIHYLKLTERNVQGPNYFRGKGFSFDIIRYKLDFENSLKDDFPIVLEVSLNKKNLDFYEIDITSEDFSAIIKELNISLKKIDTANPWFTISSENLEFDETILENILSVNIENYWGKFEELLNKKVYESLKQKATTQAIETLKKLEFEIITSTNQIDDLFFACSTSCLHQVIYRIKFFPPDLIEITQFVLSTYYDDVSSLLSENSEFILLTEKYSTRNKDVRMESHGYPDDIFYANMKKSFRAEPIYLLSDSLGKELEKWKKIEAEILRIISKSHDE